VENARDGYSYEEGDYTLDCTPSDAHIWVDEFEKYHRDHPDLFLSCDIETPEKDSDESELDLETGSDYVILRCGYSYRDGHALSIPWDGPYRLVHHRLLQSAAAKCWWNGSYDQPRIISQGISIGGASHDGMDAWHILNSDLKKSLNFVTPFFRKRLKMWKHLSGAKPAFYNAVDADAAGSNLRGTIDLLKRYKLYDVYREFVLELDPVYAEMTRAGMPIDKSMRLESAHMLTEKKRELLHAINEMVPQHIRPTQPKEGYKKTPKDLTGLTEITLNGVLNKYCSRCGIADPKKSHFRPKMDKRCSQCGGHWTLSHVKSKKKAVNPCEGASYTLVESNSCALGVVAERLEGEKRWAKVLPFVPSTKGILKYQAAKKHKVTFVGKGEERKASTDEKAIKKAIGNYPDDPIYPAILEFRDVQTISSRYVGTLEDGKLVGGFPVGRDSRVHGIFRHTPSTLRSSMVSPNLQNIPRGDDSEYARLVKQLFVAPPGNIFVARDFSGIEAVLVGAVHAVSQSYTRFAKTDIHSYFTAHNLIRLGVLTKADEPQLSWSDQDLKDFGKSIKHRFKVERDIGKRCIHAGNYRVGAKKLHEEYPQWFHKIKDAAEVLGFYYEVFPEIDKWHERLCLQVDRSAVISNSFGHTHRFYQVMSWEKVDGKWEHSYAEDAKRLIAFGPQSDAALIGKRSTKRLFYNYPETMAKWLRLFIHDENFVECPIDRADEADQILQYEMEQPIPEMRLDPSWGMGEFLSIATEGKRGTSWASMK
jgi:DNA polymerase I-like protein with 3'-5' exonuclease and polymerase domains